MSRPPGLFIVPTIHPARFFRDATLAFAAVQDWKKAVRVQREGVTRVHRPIEPWQWHPSLTEVRGFFTTRLVLDGGPYSVDFEATVEGEPVCMAVWSCKDPRESYGICVPFLSQGGAKYWSPEEWPIVFNIVKLFLEAPHIPKVGQNVVGYDWGIPPWNTRSLVKRAWGIDVQGTLADTMVDHHACFPELRHALAFQASIATDLPPYKFEYHETLTETEDDDDEDDWTRLLDKPDEATRVYCLKDAYATAECYSGLEVEKSALRCHEFGRFGMAMVPIVAEVGLRGLPFNATVRERMVADMDSAVSTIDYRLFAAGIAHPSSSKQLGAELLAAGVPLRKKTATGQWATDLEVLGRIDFEYNGATDDPPYPFLHDVLQRARLTKLRSMARSFTPCNDGMLRTALKYIATKSTRYSSSGFGRAGKPGFCPECRAWGTHGTNCQNFPKPRPAFPFNLRALIEAQPGWCLATLDFKAFELWIQAYRMRCQKLIDRLGGPDDLHTIHAELMFGKGQVVGRRRRLSKIYIYAKRGFGGPRAIQIAFAKDDEFVEQSDIAGWDRVIDAEYPEFAGHIIGSQADIDRQRKRGERVIVRNGFGRPRVLLGFDPLKEYIATEISSTAADIMNGVLWRLAERGSPAYKAMVMQIHDEFVLYAPEKQMPALIREVEEEMIRPQWLWDQMVSFPIEASWGRSWATLEPFYA